MKFLLLASIVFSWNIQKDDLVVKLDIPEGQHLDSQHLVATIDGEVVEHSYSDGECRIALSKKKGVCGLVGQTCNDKSCSPFSFTFDFSQKDDLSAYVILMLLNVLVIFLLYR